MTNKSVVEFVGVRERLDDKEYFVTTLAYHLAPISISKKPSSILTFNKHGRNMYNLWEQYKNTVLKKTRIRFYELKRDCDKIYVLFFIPQRLMDVLTCKKHIEFLNVHGYKEHPTLYKYLSTLKKKYSKECPHEIGIFLGVPLEDVESFIKNKGKNYLLCGYWKVYHQLEKCIVTFETYNQAKSKVVELVSMGCLTELIAS